MTILNTTIDDTSPLISYSPPGAWTAGNQANDPDSSAGLYSNNGTFTLTTTNAATATLEFNGTAVYIFGAKRSNHGSYSITLDGQTSADDSGFAPGSGIFRTALYAMTGLRQGQHVVTITNIINQPNAPFLDIDFVTWTSEVEQGGTFSTVTVEDSDPSFDYEPPGAWSTSVTTLPGFSGNSGHSSFLTGNSVTYTFSGDTITLYGAVGPTASSYSAQLDNNTAINFNATQLVYHAQQPLFFADNLGPGSHSLKLINQPSAFGQGLSIDYAVVGTITGGVALSPSSSAKPTTSTKPISSTVIIGIIVGVIVLFLIIIALLITLIIRRRKRKVPWKADAFVAAQPATANYQPPASFIPVPVPIAQPVPQRQNPAWPGGFAVEEGSAYPGTSVTSQSVWSSSASGYHVPQTHGWGRMSGSETALTGNEYRRGHQSQESGSAVPTSPHSPYSPESAGNLPPVPAIPDFPPVPTTDPRTLTGWSAKEARMNAERQQAPRAAGDSEYVRGGLGVNGRTQVTGSLLPPAYEQATQVMSERSESTSGSTSGSTRPGYI